MRNFAILEWAVRDSWAEFPDQAGKLRRTIAVALANSPVDTVAVIGTFHPEAVEHQSRALVVARRIVSLHNANLG